MRRSLQWLLSCIDPFTAFKPCLIPGRCATACCYTVCVAVLLDDSCFLLVLRCLGQNFTMQPETPDIGGLPFVARAASLACIGGLAFVVCASDGFLLWLVPAYVFLTIASDCNTPALIVTKRRSSWACIGNPNLCTQLWYKRPL